MSYLEPKRLVVGFVVFLGLVVCASLTSKETQAATDHYVTPILFYANDSSYPAESYLTGINNAMGHIRSWYAAQTGETFEFLPARRVQGLSGKAYYRDSNYFGCRDYRMYCNITIEMALHEKDSARFFASPDTGFGWAHRAVMVFTYDIYGSTNGELGWGLTSIGSEFGEREVTWGVMSDPVTNWLNTPTACANAFGCGIPAHELGHAFGKLPDGCAGVAANDLMCNSGTYPNSTLSESYKQLVRNSKFTNPPPVGTFAPFFCFSAESVTGWCTGPSIVVAGDFKSIESEGVPPPSIGTADCCRSDLSQRVTIGGFKVEWCIAGVARGNSTYCQKSSTLVGTYSTTLQLKPLKSDGSKLYYDVYVDYLTISSGTIKWKEQKNVNQLCYASTCPYTVSWAKPVFDATLYRANTTTSACQGYSNCSNVDTSVPESNPFANFDDLPPELSVDMIVRIRPMENSGTPAIHWLAQSLKTPNCSPRSPTALSAPTLGQASLSGSPGTQSLTLNWTPPSSWGNECNLGNPREYKVALGLTNPPPYYERTTNTSITIPNINPGSVFYWRVAAENAGNKGGSYSAIGSVSTAPVNPEFTGYYFDDPLNNIYLFNRIDPKVQFNWGAGSPDPRVGPDDFGVIWSGTFPISGGTYRLNFQVDETAWVTLDGEQIFNVTTPGIYSIKKYIAPGYHRFTVNYKEKTGAAYAKFNWVSIATCNDISGDYNVNSLDSRLISNNFGPVGANTGWDFNSDNVIDSKDRDIMLTKFGQVCPQ